MKVLRNPSDFWSGLIFVGFGLAAVLIGRDYSMGTASRMGPAYFPTILGTILVIIGALAIVRSTITQGQPIPRFPLKELILVLGATIVFGLLMRGAGLPAATIVMVMLGGSASIKFKVGPYLLLAVGMAVFCVLVFVKALGLPMPMFGPWLGF